jgi:hypothetical protein
MQFELTFNVGTGFDRFGNELDEFSVHAGMKHFREELIEAGGGFTETATLGGWRDDSGKLVQETGMQWRVLIETRTRENAAVIARALAQNAAAWFRQASVMVQTRETFAEFVEARESEPVRL